MAVSVMLHIVYGGIPVVDELQMEDLGARANPGVEVLMLELQGQPERVGIEPYGSSEIGGPQLSLVTPRMVIVTPAESPGSVGREPAHSA
jgi:hypothetical protein